MAQSNLRKRKRDSPDDLTRTLIRNEVDLEIALRRRLENTIRSRITWAMLLQSNVNPSLHSSSTKELIGAFPSIALQIVDDLEEDLPCITAPSLVPRNTTRRLHLSHSSTEDLETLSRRTKPHTFPPRPATRPKFLFFRDQERTPPVIYRLACSICARADFSGVHALLNHARSKHKVDWANHDECIKNCSTLVSDSTSHALILEEGVEVATVSLPSVRGLFERAVGVGVSTTASPVSRANPATLDDGAAELSHSESIGIEDRNDRSLVASTLGHHKDSPALAAFLGKAPKLRLIHSMDEDSVVDVHTGDSGRWCMSFQPRSGVRETATDEVLPGPILLGPSGSDTTVPEIPLFEPTGALSDTGQVHPFRNSSSRFHISARVLIADRSKRMHLSRRDSAPAGHTHQWMVSVRSSSYSLPLSTFLDTMTISCLTEPPPSTLITPIVITEPPFTVISTSDRPFLARVTFVWAGDNSPSDVDHWVDLTSSETLSVLEGEEEILDIELDRQSVLFPERKESKALTWGGHLMTPRVTTEMKDEAPYIPILRSLLPRAPMTLQDDKLHRKGSNILPMSSRHFHGMVIGRQKAIEFARARTLRDAYHKALSSRTSGSVSIPTLSTGSIHRWLKHESPQSRSTHRRLAGLDFQTSPPESNTVELASTILFQFCSVCGYRHVPDHVAEAITCPFSIKSTSQLPWIDAKMSTSLHASRSLPQDSKDLAFVDVSTSWGSSYARELLELANPQLTVAVHHLLSLHSQRSELENLYNLTADETSHLRAPIALLAMTTKIFARRLILFGLQASDEYRRAAMVTSNKNGVNGLSPGILRGHQERVLTPGHILEGVLRGRYERLGAAVYLCLTNMGLASRGLF